MTGIVAAVIFAALAVMVFAMRPAQPGPEPHAEPRPYTRSEPQSHEAERQELPAGSALAEPVPASH